MFCYVFDSGSRIWLFVTPNSDCLGDSGHRPTLTPLRGPMTEVAPDDLGASSVLPKVKSRTDL